MYATAILGTLSTRNCDDISLRAIHACMFRWINAIFPNTTKIHKQSTKGLRDTLISLSQNIFHTNR